jgi:hypothetical protein
LVQASNDPADNDSMLDNANAPQDAASQGTHSSAEIDFAAMQAQIDALLNGGGEAEASSNASVDSASPMRDVREASLDAPPIDPLIQEIDAALADDADALLKGAGGDVGAALKSVFDERALSGQEEEINRALIEAFGTSRVATPSFSSPQVTNPLPGFDGAARKITPEIARDERRPAEVAVEAAPGTPEPASTKAPAVSTAAHAESQAVTHAKPMEHDTVSHAAPNPSRATESAAPASASSSIEAKPEPSVRAPRSSAITSLVDLAARVLSAPMRAMPDSARVAFSIAAITMVMWTPVAWWLAHRSTQTPAVAPITIKPAAVVAAAAEPAKQESGGSGH